MLTPAETFSLQRNMFWVAPCLSCLGAMLVMNSFFPSAEWEALCILTVACVTWLLAQVYIWLTVFDARTTLVLSAALLVFFTLPISAAVPNPWGASYQLPWAIGSLVFQLAVLCMLTVWRWRKLQALSLQSGSVLTWHRCRVNLKTSRIEALRDSVVATATIGATSVWVGAASVLAYPVLSWWLGEGGLLVFAVIAGHGIALWFHVELVSYWLAQALTLKAIQNRTGQRFVADQLEFLEQQRQSHGWGRFLRRIWPCPVALKPFAQQPAVQGVKSVRHKRDQEGRRRAP